MRIERRAALVLICLLALAVRAQDGPGGGEAAAGQGEQIEFSEAERTLWMTEQLGEIAEPAKLTYAFRKSGSFEEGFEDTVVLKILEVKAGGMKHAAVTFFTGERNQFVPENENTNVNPVLGIYLQGDVYEMERLTDGHWRYFHRALKRGFAEEASVEDVTIEFDGRRYAARRVTMTPYLDDPRREDMGEFARKRYAITVADELPGYLYAIHTQVPPETAGAEPLLDERLRLVEVAPLEAGDTP